MLKTKDFESAIFILRIVFTVTFICCCYNDWASWSTIIVDIKTTSSQFYISLVAALTYNINDYRREIVDPGLQLCQT